MLWLSVCCWVKRFKGARCIIINRRQDAMGAWMLGGWRVLWLPVVSIIYTFFLKGSLVKVHKW